MNHLKFGRIFAETIWASFKALLLCSSLFAVVAGFIVQNIDLPSGGGPQSFTATFILSLLGGLLFMPIVFIFDLIVAAPAFRWLLQKKYIDQKIFIAVGAFNSFCFFKFFDVISKKSFDLRGFFWDGIWYLTGGAILGWFLHRQIFGVANVDEIEKNRMDLEGHGITLIKVVPSENVQKISFKKHLADCVILTHDNKILMQQRPESWGKHAGVLNIFGGHVEEGESVIQALIRELHEELGAIVKPSDIIFLGAVSEDETNHTELVHVHFWHDKENTITGCYEAEDKRYDSMEEALAHPKIMDYARWALLEAKARGYL